MDFGMEEIDIFSISASAGMFMVKYLIQFSEAGVGEFLLLCWGGCVAPAEKTSV